MKPSWTEVAVIGLLLGFAVIMAHGWPAVGNDLAAWVQAIGSIVAIIASVLIVQHQITQSRLSNESAATSRVLSFVMMLDHLSKELQALPHFNKDILRLRHAMLEEWLHDARGIAFEHLSSEWAIVLSMMRASTIQLAQCLLQAEGEYSREALDEGLKHSADVALREAITVFTEDLEVQVAKLRECPSTPHFWQRSGTKGAS